MEKAELDMIDKGAFDNDAEVIAVPVRGRGSPKVASAYLGLAFLLVFAPFGVIQAFTTTLLPSTGFLSLALVYGSFTVSSLCAPVLISIWPFRGDARICMAAASVFYVLWQVAVACKDLPFVLVASLLLGMAAGLLWVGQSVYLDSAAGCQRHLVALGRDETDKVGGDVVGTLNAWFFFFSGFAPILGNLITLVILSFKVPLDYMVWSMAAIGCLGVASLVFADARYREGFPSTPGVPILSAKDELVKRANEIWTAVKSSKGLRLLPLFILQGSSPAWTFGIFPTLIPMAGIPAERVPWTLALLFLIYGATLTPWSLALGKIYRHGGWRYLLAGIFVFQSIAYTLLILLGQGFFGSVESAATWTIVVVAAISSGIIDGTATSLSSNCITSSHKSGAMPVFSLYRATAALSFCLISIIATLIPYYAIAGIEWFVGIATLCTISSLMRRVDIEEASRQAQFQALARC